MRSADCHRADLNALAYAPDARPRHSANPQFRTPHVCITPTLGPRAVAGRPPCTALPRTIATTPVRTSSLIPKPLSSEVIESIFSGSPVTSIITEPSATSTIRAR